MDVSREVDEFLATLNKAVYDALSGPPASTMEQAKGLEGFLNARALALGEGFEFSLTGVEGRYAHFEVKPDDVFVRRFTVETKIVD